VNTQFLECDSVEVAQMSLLELKSWARENEVGVVASEVLPMVKLVADPVIVKMASERLGDDRFD